MEWGREKSPAKMWFWLWPSLCLIPQGALKCEWHHRTHLHLHQRELQCQSICQWLWRRWEWPNVPGISRWDSPVCQRQFSNAGHSRKLSAVSTPWPGRRMPQLGQQHLDWASSIITFLNQKHNITQIFLILTPCEKSNSMLIYSKPSSTKPVAA